MNKELVPKTEWQEMLEKADKMVKSKFLPVAINTAEKAVAIAMMGKELGLGMMESFRSINVIQGKPTMSVALMLALAQRTGKLENQKIEAIPNAQNPVKVKYTLTRKGQSPHIEEFGDAEAKAMGLLNKDNYRKQKFTMYKWRVVGNALRMVFGDVLHGVYTPEELGAEVEVVDDEMKIKAVPTSLEDDIDTGLPPPNPKLETPKQIGPLPSDAAGAGIKTQPPKPKAKPTADKKKTLRKVIWAIDEIADKVASNKKAYAWINTHTAQGVEEKFYCYSQTAITKLKEAKRSGETADAEFEETGYGNKILSVELGGDAQEPVGAKDPQDLPYGEGQDDK